MIIMTCILRDISKKNYHCISETTEVVFASDDICQVDYSKIYERIFI